MPLTRWLPSVLLATVSCNSPSELPGIPIECVNVTPGLAGSWAGSVSGQEMTLKLTESCERSFGDSWVVRGQWQWAGLSGPVESDPYSRGGGTIVVLSVGPLLGARDVVRLVIPQGPPFAAASSLTGNIVGRWPNATDPSQSLASFDSAAVTFSRR